VALLLAIPLVQWLAYTAFARYVFRVPGKRAWLLGGLRVVAGAAIYWPIKVAATASFFATHLFSAPLAWAIVALFDPRRSWRRWLLWIVVGTVASVALNLLIFGTTMRDDYFKDSLRLIPG
jgi:hypothetical protein